MSPLLRVLASVLTFGLVTYVCAVDLVSYRQAVLNRHNEYRAKHQAPPLTLNATISAVSQKWANYLRDNNLFQHSKGSGFGENLYWMKSSIQTFEVGPNNPVDSWYNEIKDYDFDVATFSSKTGHFTQVVWKDSLQLGVGIATLKGVNIVVCNYSPPGNYLGEFSENVLPAVS